MRLTLDIDDKSNPTKLDNMIDNLKLMFPHSHGELYETSHGYHIIVYDTGLSFSKVLKLRQKLGDDPRRVRLDSLLIDKPKNVLFTEKNGHRRNHIGGW